MNPLEHVCYVWGWGGQGWQGHCAGAGASVQQQGGLCVAHLVALRLASAATRGAAAAAARVTRPGRSPQELDRSYARESFCAVRGAKFLPHAF
eukprot:1193592-Prorocentrum_minimum.AAC.1